MSVVCFDCEDACSVEPGLIWPVSAFNPGLVGTVALSSAPVDPLMPTQTTAAASIASLR
jgi:hypothetical protein